MNPAPSTAPDAGGRFGELEGHMHGYDTAVVTRAIAQTLADRRFTYLALPDEAGVTAFSGPWVRDRCMVPWRDDLRQFAYYCLLPAGHDDDVDAGDQAVEHGWYRLLDAYERGARAMDEAAARISERADAAIGRLRS